MRALRNFLVRLFLLITVIGILFGVVFGLTPMANADMQPADALLQTGQKSEK